MRSKIAAHNTKTRRILIVTKWEYFSFAFIIWIWIHMVHVPRQQSTIFKTVLHFSLNTQQTQAHTHTCNFRPINAANTMQIHLFAISFIYLLLLLRMALFLMALLYVIANNESYSFLNWGVLSIYIYFIVFTIHSFNDLESSRKNGARFVLIC